MAKVAIDQDYLTHPDCTDLDHIPGSDGIPYFGTSLSTIWGLPALVDRHYEKWGEVSRIKILHQRGLLVMGEDNFQRIFLDTDKNFSTEMGFAESLGQFYRGGILIKDFDEHRTLRRMMQVAFKNAAMKEYVALMNPIMQQHIEEWDEVNDFQFFPHIKEALLEVGAKVFLNVELGEEADRINKAFLDINDGLLGQLRKEIPGTKYNRGKQGERYLRKYFTSEIAKRRGRDDLHDTFSYVCNAKDEDGNYFAEDLVIPQGSFLLFAAHDTTTSVLNHIMYYTAIHPEWQEAMREECLALNKEYLDYEDLEKMTVVDSVFKETLRLRPSVPLSARRTIKECEISGHRVPADTVIWMPPMHQHMNPEYWTDPEKFDPDRFSPERAEYKNHSFCYHPFGGGAHKCIGLHFAAMLTKTFMHQILLKYRYSLPEDFKPRFEWAPLPKPAKLPIQWERL
jgi:cytochrome P450